MIQETLQSAEEQMDRTIEATREDFASCLLYTSDAADE